MKFNKELPELRAKVENLQQIIDRYEKEDMENNRDECLNLIKNGIFELNVIEIDFDEKSLILDCDQSEQIIKEIGISDELYISENSGDLINSEFTVRIFSEEDDNLIVRIWCSFDKFKEYNLKLKSGNNLECFLANTVKEL